MNICCSFIFFVTCSLTHFHSHSNKLNHCFFSTTFPGWQWFSLVCEKITNQNHFAKRFIENTATKNAKIPKRENEIIANRIAFRLFNESDRFRCSGNVKCHTVNETNPVRRNNDVTMGKKSENES